MKLLFLTLVVFASLIVAETDNVSVRFAKNSIDELDSCTTVAAVSIPSKLFRDEDISTSLSTAFVYRQQKKQYDAVVNRHGTIVGQIIGSGVTLEFETSRPIKNVTVCLPVESQIDEYDNYEDYDLGRVQSFDDQEIRPYGYDRVEFEDGLVCAYGVELGETYFPIYRDSDWEDEDDEFDSTEKGLFYTSAIVYSILAAICLVMIVLLPFDIAFLRSVEKWASNQALAVGVLLHPRPWIWFLLLTFNTFRAVFFFLLVNKFFDENDDYVIDYALFEFPIFILFSAFSLMIFLWVIVINNAARKNRLPIFGAFLVFNMLMYSIFVMLVVLYDHFEEDDDEETCALIIPSESDDDGQSDAQRTLTEVYRYILAGIAGAIALVTSIVGFRIISMLKDFNRKTNTKRNITIMTIVGAFGFLGVSVFLLIWTIEDITINDFVWGTLILLLLEAIPQLALMYVFKPRGLSSMSDRSSRMQSKWFSSQRSFKGSADSGGSVSHIAAMSTKGFTASVSTTSTSD